MQRTGTTRRIITILSVATLALGGGWAWRVTRARAPVAHVETTTASRGEFVVSLPAEGTLQSDDAVAVRTGKAPGELTMIVSDGTVVRAGDVFCRIEARELLRKQTDAELAFMQAQEEIEQTRDTALENYENAQRVLEQAKRNMQVWEESVGVRTKQAADQLEFDRAEAERLRLEYERAQRMAAKGYAAESEAEIARAAYEAQQFKVEQSTKDLELSRRQIESERRQKQSLVAAAEQRAQVSQRRIEQQVAHARSRAQSAARQLQTVVSALAETTIKAPVSGTVSLLTTYQGGERRSWREGDQVSVGTTLGSVSGSDRMSVRCRIKESNVSLLKNGQEAELEFEALSGRIYRGVVSSVGTVAREVWVWEDPTAEANERVFDVIIKVDQSKPGGLKPGLNARARIFIKRMKEEVYVPLDAVFERAGKSLVYVKQGARFVPREVETGDRNEVAVVIVAGLKAGEPVALSDPTRAAQRQPRRGQGK